MNTDFFASQQAVATKAGEVFASQVRANMEFAVEAASKIASTTLDQGQSLFAVRDFEAGRQALIEGMNSQRQVLNDIAKSGQELFTGHIKAAEQLGQVAKAGFEEATQEASSKTKRR